MGTPEAAARVETLLGDIFRRYGDHLYGKGDFEGAMSQFIKTIGFTPPSYVIRKFLDAQRINNLTSYLHELHARGLANSDHTTLLLNCYTKLKDVNSLNRFIKRPLTLSSDSNQEEDDGINLLGEDDDEDMEGGRSTRDDLPFDLETAMRVCRQAGYYSHAAYLARKYNEHDEYIRIQIEDCKNFEETLTYLRSLNFQEIEVNLLRYGKTLLNELPEKTTDLLIELCSGRFKTTPVGNMVLNGDGKESKTKEIGQGKSPAAAFLASLQVGGYSNNGGKNDSSSSRPTSNVEPYSLESRRGSTPALNSSTPQQQQADEQIVQEESYPTPSPTIFFPHFIRHRPQFVRFLSTIAEVKWGQRIESKEIWDQQQMIKGKGNEKNKSKRTEPETEEEEAERVLRELGLTSNEDDEDGLSSEQKDQRAVWITLLELYLRSSSSNSNSASFSSAKANHPNSKDKRISYTDSKAGISNGTQLDGDVEFDLSKKGQREKALRLLEQNEALPFDRTHALVICSMEKFTEGIVLLYEQMEMFEEILRFWMDVSLDEMNGESGSKSSNNSSFKVLETLDRYGPDHPHLYSITLTFLISSQSLLSKHQKGLKEILNYIEEESLMSPLEVVQLLSRNGNTNVGIVRDYLRRSIESEREEIDGVSMSFFR